MALRVAGSSCVRVPPTGETGLAIHHSLYAAGSAESIIPIACESFPLGPGGAPWEIWDRGIDPFRGFGPDQIRGAFTSTLFGHYIPLTRLSWSLNYAFGGLNPWSYHLANVLLHAGNALTFYVVARRLLAAAVGRGEQEGRTRLDV